LLKYFIADNTLAARFSSAAVRQPGLLHTQPTPQSQPTFTFGPSHDPSPASRPRLHAWEVRPEPDKESVRSRHSTPLGYQDSYARPLNYAPALSEAGGGSRRGGEVATPANAAAHTPQIVGVDMDANSAVPSARRPYSTSGASVSRGVPYYDPARLEVIACNPPHSSYNKPHNSLTWSRSSNRQARGRNWPSHWVDQRY